MAVTQTESSLLDTRARQSFCIASTAKASSTLSLMKLWGTTSSWTWETGKVNMTEGRPVFRIDNWEGSNYLTIDPDLIRSVASMSSKMSQFYRHATPPTTDW